MQQGASNIAAAPGKFMEGYKGGSENKSNNYQEQKLAGK
jgi:hypothetical protein